MSNTISQYVHNQPGATQNVRDNYPIVLDFLQAYYAWMEQTGRAVSGIFTTLDNRDIDKTLGAFLKYFEYEFLPDIPTTMLADPRKLVKRARDFYQARGAEKSYQLLFRILYNDSVEFYYPKIDLLKPSDGKWSVDTVIRTTTANDTYQFIGRQIVGVTSHATASVENVVKLALNATTVSEIYISNLSIIGEFQIGEQISVLLPNNTTVNETVYGLATGITLTNPGTAYKFDDLITTPVPSGGSAALFSVNVIGGTDTGRVVRARGENYPQQPLIQVAQKASTINNYYTGMDLTITDGSGSGQVVMVTNYDGGQQVANINPNWQIVPDITSHYSISLGNIKTIKVKDFGYNYTTPVAADFTLSGDGNASGTITVGAVGHYAGRYVNSDGFVSDKNKIQDSYYYQDFSYVLKVHETLSQYVNVVKKILHPAGLALFGDVIVDGLNFARKTHTLSSTIISTTFSGTPPVENLSAQYSMLVDTNPQLVYDDSGVYPTGYNATLGALQVSDINDPTWESAGSLFANTYDNFSVLPIDLSQQTMVVVAKANALQDNSGIVGCIDNTNDTGVSGFQINVNFDGSITFRAQKMNPLRNDLRVSYPAGSVNTSDYFVASLRYFNDTVVANLNTQPSISGSFGYDVDGTTITNNSRGFYLGVGGFHPSMDSYPPLSGIGGSLPGSTISGISPSVILPVTLMRGYFNGVISYFFLYDRFLIDQEILDVYQFIKGVMVGRGISLP
jgi:hypothetical protein